MSTPTVSILIPAFNTAPFIGEALESVFAQTFQDFEVIVVNDGSPDTPELERVLQDYRTRITYVQQDNTGVAGARNAALHLAQGRYIALLDSDDRWDREYLAIHVAILAADPTVDVVFADALLFGDTPHRGRSYMEVHPLRGNVTFERLLRRECYVWGGVTARREIVMEAGAFDPEQRSAEDLDLWLRILLQGGKIVYHRRVLAEYRMRNTSLSADPSGAYVQLLRLCNKLEQQFPLTATQRTAVAARRELVLAEQSFFRGKQAFFRADFCAARAHLRSANVVLRNPRTAVVLLLLRVAPVLLLHVYRFRDRLRRTAPIHA